MKKWLLIFILIPSICFAGSIQHYHSKIAKSRVAGGTITKESNDTSFHIQWKTCGDNGGGECDGNMTIDTGSGNDRMVVVGVMTEDNDGAVDVTNVKFNSVSCDAGPNLSIVDGAERMTVEIWYCLDTDLPASSGTYAIRPYLDVQADDISWHAISLTGVKQAVPDDSGTDSCNDDTCTNTTKDAVALTAAGNNSFAFAVSQHNDPGGNAFTGTYSESIYTTQQAGSITSSAGGKNSISSGAVNVGFETIADENRSVFAAVIWEPS
jgi:hypothetical protein